jgi:hypothetical protein
VVADAALGTADAVASAVSGEAHSPQKVSPGSLAAPHTWHRTASGAAHFEQNFLPGRFSVPQLAQITIGA